jgi:hypothetical protein
LILFLLFVIGYIFYEIKYERENNQTNSQTNCDIFPEIDGINISFDKKEDLNS